MSYDNVQPAIGTEVHPAPSVTVRTDQGIRRVQAIAASSKQSVFKVNQLNTTSSLGGLFTGSQSIIFDIRGLSICYLRKKYVALTIANTGLTNAVLVNAPFLFDRITLFCGGASVYDYNSDDQWWSHMGSLDIPQTELLAQLENWDPTTYSSATKAGTTGEGLIPAGESRTIYIELNTMLNQAQVPLAEVLGVQPWRIQCFLTANPFVSTSTDQTASSLNVTNAQLYCFGDELSDKALAQLQSELRSEMHSYQCHTPFRQILSQGNVNLNTSSINNTLTGFDGTYSGLQIFVRAANAAGGGNGVPESAYQYNYTTGDPATVAAAAPGEWRLTNLTVKDSSGAPIYVSQLDDKLLRLVPARLLRDSRFNTVFYDYNFDFAPQPIAAAETGASVADVRMRTNWSFTANYNSLATGQTSVNTELVIIGLRQTMIDISTTGRIDVRML